MKTLSHHETPRAVAIRIFGASLVLLASMLAFLHPQAVEQAVHAMMSAMP